jgi:hypothetical protein
MGESPNIYKFEIKCKYDGSKEEDEYDEWESINFEK